ncbi:hypothetical protein DEO72_LG10g2469 [Vigna unguiculata]|uniref:Uncharacterized protein n=1 Tax=Vigna unguiculata TaxID=3917 RepID=A0A4D6NC05_VIGUN|nr:hypothetical protein DEO72_LG10g2469 [Vigna unguiculata]
MFVFLEKFQKSSGGLLVAARRLMLFISVLPGEASLITQFWVSLMKGLAVEIDLPGDASIVGSIFREMQKMGTRRLGRCDRTWIFPMYDASPNQIWCTVKRQGRTQKHSGDFRCVGFELDVVVTFGMDCQRVHVFWVTIPAGREGIFGALCKAGFI